VDPQYPFGHGLGYIPFNYANLVLSNTNPGRSDILNISVEVSNAGNRAGFEVVQLYVSDLVASMVPPVKRLRGFQKIFLEAGEKRNVNFQLPVRDLSFVNRDNRWILEPGEFKVSIGGLGKIFYLRDPTPKKTVTHN
jgi:beta-glucosidase